MASTPLRGVRGLRIFRAIPAENSDLEFKSLLPDSMDDDDDDDDEDDEDGEDDDEDDEDEGVFDCMARSSMVAEIYKDDIKELAEIKDHLAKVKEFLATIRRSFPHVIISDQYDMDLKNGRTNKLTYEGSFEPKRAAVIEINAILVDRLVDASKKLLDNRSKTNQKRVNALFVRLAITMAHELVHVFVLFLVRSSRHHTPGPVSFGRFRTRVVGKSPSETRYIGESGRYWEGHVLGGGVDMRSRRSNDVETVALQDEFDSFHVINDRVIKGILNCQFDQWLPRGTTIIEQHRGTTEKLEKYLWKRKYDEILPDVDDEGDDGDENDESDVGNESDEGDETHENAENNDTKEDEVQHEFSLDQLDQLTGPWAMGFNCYDVHGQAMRDYVLQPPSGDALEVIVHEAA